MIGKFWRWLNKDAEFGAMPSLASVSGDFTAGEHAYALFMRLVFLISEAALIGFGLISIPGFIWLYMTVLAFPTPLEFICAIVTPLALWLCLRKGHAMVRTAVFDAIRRRGAARQARSIERDNVALEATAASSGSPMAVSVDVDHDHDHDHDQPAHARK